MKRRQLFEIQDFPWCPQVIRDGVTELLYLNLKLLRIYHPIVPKLRTLIESSSGDWVDLCAGSGGGSLLLLDKVGATVKSLTLTDLYPPAAPKGWPPGVFYYDTPVDARRVPPSLTGARTLFTSFHHLPDTVASDVLKDAFEKRCPIGVFEFTQRSLINVLMVLPSLFTSFFLIPFIRPFNPWRLILTYLVPVIPLVTAFDIVMTCFRTRTPSELRDLIQNLEAPDYTWEVGQVRTTFGFQITYLVGQKSSLPFDLVAPD